MPNSCCVPGCKSNYKTSLDAGEPAVSTFTFPKDENLKAQWLRNISRQTWSPSKHSVVCAKHFIESDIIREDDYRLPDGSLQKVPTKTRLKLNAVPSTFPNLPNHLPKTVPVPDSTDKIVVDVDVHHRHCSQINGSITTTNNIRAATTADLSKAYRAWSNGFPIQRKHRKTNAERAKEYRARKKAKIQTEGNNQCSNSSDNQYRNLRDNQTIREQIQEHRDLHMAAVETPADILDPVKIEIKEEALPDCMDLLLDVSDHLVFEEIQTEINDDEIIDNCDNPALVDYTQACKVETNISPITVPTSLTSTFDEESRKSESQIFGNLVAQEINKYSPELSSVVQDDIMKILCKADIIHYNQKKALS